MRKPFMLMLMLAAVATASAQDGTIRVEARLVEINVVVRDGNGPVAGLTREDFTILDNGRPQSIDLFVPSEQIRQQPGSPMPPGVAANLLNTEGIVPQGATVILLDLINTSSSGQVTAIVDGEATNTLTAMNDQRDAIKQLVGYLRTVGPEDRVALFVLADQVYVMQDFTGDPEVLVRAAEKIRAMDLAGVEVNTHEQLVALLEPPPVSNTDGTLTYVGGPSFANMLSTNSTINRAIASADAFEAIARHMSGLPGRKNLVWLSAGFPFRPVVAERILGQQAQRPVETPDDFSQHVDRAARALNDANVSIYPVDYQGLKAGYPEVMVRLADATGGDVAYRTNDLRQAVTAAVVDADISYTLGFYLPTDRLDGRKHDLDVRVNRRGVDVHHRADYYAVSPTIPERERQRVLGELIGSDLNSSQLEIVALGEPDPATPGNFRVTINVNGAGLNLTQEGDLRTGRLTLAMRLQSSESRQVNAGTIPLSFTEQQYQNIMNRGFVVRQSVAAKAGDRLRIVVQDQTTGLAGAVWLPLVAR